MGEDFVAGFCDQDHVFDPHATEGCRIQSGFHREDLVLENLAAAVVQQEVDAYNARLASWVFAIPDYKADIIAREMSELLKDPEALNQSGVLPADLPLSMEDLYRYGTPPGNPPPAVGTESPMSPETPDTPGADSDGDAGEALNSTDEQPDEAADPVTETTAPEEPDEDGS